MTGFDLTARQRLLASAIAALGLTAFFVMRFWPALTVAAFAVPLAVAEGRR